MPDISLQDPPTIEPATASASAGGDWRKYLIPSPTELGYKGRRSSTAAADLTNGLDLSNLASARELRSSSSRESVTGDGSLLSHEDRRRHFVRSRTNPDFVEPPQQPARSHLNSESGTTHRYRTDSIGSQDGRASNDETSGSHHGGSRSEREAEQRKNRYRRKAERSHSGFAATGGSTDDLDPYVGLDPRVADAAQRFEVSIQGNGVESPASGTGGARFYRVFTQPKIEYLSKGRCLGKFGAKGNGEGQFNWPRGLAIVPESDEIAGKRSWFFAES